MVAKFNVDKKDDKVSKEQKLKVFDDSGSNLEGMISQLNSELVKKCEEFNENESGQWRWEVGKSAKDRWNIKMQYIQFTGFIEGKQKRISFYLGMVSYLLKFGEKVSIEITKDTIEIKVK
jgi:hypothetical protein